MIVNNTTVNRPLTPLCCEEDHDHVETALPVGIADSVDLDAAELAVRDLLIALGEDVEREGLLDTPRRVAKAMSQIMAGRHANPAEILSRRFTQPSDEPIALKNITFHSLCEHHLLPFVGRAHVAYLPGNDQVVGLSKLARLVDAYAKQPQIQERLTNQVADALEYHLGAAGVAVIISAEHYCMKMRGVSKQDSQMQTMAMRGVYKNDRQMRAEILSLLNSNNASHDCC